MLIAPVLMLSQGPRGLPGPPGPMGLRGVGDTGAKVRFFLAGSILVSKNAPIST